MKGASKTTVAFWLRSNVSHVYQTAANEDCSNGRAKHRKCAMLPQHFFSGITLLSVKIVGGCLSGSVHLLHILPQGCYSQVPGHILL